MTRFRHPQPGEAHATAGSGNHPAPSHRAPVVVPFPQKAARSRPALPADDARGEILLFLGVRYERLAS